MPVPALCPRTQCMSPHSMQMSPRDDHASRDLFNGRRRAVPVRTLDVHVPASTPMLVCPRRDLFNGGRAQCLSPRSVHSWRARLRPATRSWWPECRNRGMSARNASTGSTKWGDRPARPAYGRRRWGWSGNWRWRRGERSGADSWYLKQSHQVPMLCRSRSRIPP